MKRVTMITTAVMFACFLLAETAVFASDQQPSGLAAQGQSVRQGQGPLVLEPVKNGFEVAAEVKVADINKRTGTLVGASGGWLVGNTLYLGGAGYWLVDHPDDIGMTYGGVVVGWLMPDSGAVRFGLRGLVGGGAARLSRFEVVPLVEDWRDRRRNRYDDTFAVFEPQADLLVRLAERVHLSAGLSYRVLASRNSAVERMRGVTGTLALRISGGS